MLLIITLLPHSKAMLTIVSLSLLPYSLAVFVAEQDFIVIRVAQAQNKNMTPDWMSFSLRTKQKAVEGYGLMENYDMTMFISSITDISSFSDPKVDLLQTPLQRKVLRQTFEVLKTAFQMCMGFPFYSMRQGNSILKKCVE